MPTKHIDDVAWRLTEKQTVKAVMTTEKGIKDTKVLNYALLKGLKSLNEDDFYNMAKDKNK